MKTCRPLLSALLLATIPVLPARAVYAPIPEQEQGQALTAQVAASFYHDSNLFAARAGRISTFVRRVEPGLDFHASLTDQTFFAAGYHLTLDYVDDRPGTKLLDSHEFTLRLAHSFSKQTTLDLTDTYQISANPAALLAGVPLNTDQSFQSNQLDLRYNTGLGPRGTLLLKGRATSYFYDNAALATSVDRTEMLLGLEAGFDLQPQLKLVGEYRHEIVTYDTGGATKDKNSDFLLAGADYHPSQKLTLGGRLGAEFRHRDGAASTNSPYAEASFKYDYGPRSYVSAGYTYTFEETSNVALYTDTQVSRLFANVQQSLGGSLYGSVSLSYAPSTLQGRATISPDRRESTKQLGLALTWLAPKNWTVSATADFDRLDSQDAAREYQRNRVGINVRYAFPVSFGRGKE